MNLSSSIITTQQHGERDSKEAGRQLSSFTKFEGTVIEGKWHVDTMGKLAGEKQKFMLKFLPKQVACCHRG